MESDSPISFAPSLDDSLRQIDEVATAAGVSPYITSEDATTLRKYFGTQGMSALHKSTAGAELDRAELYANPTMPCTKCGGDEQSYTGGCGWMARSKVWRMPTDAEAALIAWAGDKVKAIPPPADVVCSACKGRGWVRTRKHKNWRTIRMFWVSSRYLNGVRHPLKWNGPFTIAEAEREFERLQDGPWQEVCIAKAKPFAMPTVNAYPTGSSVKRAAGVSVTDAGMQRIAVVGRRLDMMARIWALSVDVLDCYYGPDDGGQVTSVWALTSSGKTLLRGNKLDLSPLEFFQNERNDHEEKLRQALTQLEQEREARKGKLFAEADAQANALLRAARQLWNFVSEQDLHTIDGQPKPEREADAAQA